MSVRDAITVVGTAIGAYFGYPQLGYAIGSAIGNSVDPEIIKGPSIGDISRQTSQEGVPRPIVFAMSQPIAGNIIVSGEPRIVRTRSRQGKGGPKVETESVYRTYALGVCEGPIHRFIRVWRNNMLVYDTSEAPLTTTGDNFKFLQNARFFLGSYTQNASADIEAEFGVGTTPAHRGTAYMVMANEDLTDLRGAIPQYVFQVERCEGTYVTSRPYEVHDIEGLNSTGSISVGIVLPPTEALDIYAHVTHPTTLEDVLLRYPDAAPEALGSGGEVRDASLVFGLPTIIEIENQAPEALNSLGAITAGGLDTALVAYEIDPEALNIVGSVVSATLE